MSEYLKEIHIREETLRRFGPKPADCVYPCPACDKMFMKGEYTTLITAGPGDDPGARKKARNNQPYNAVAIEVHWACATGEE